MPDDETLRDNLLDNPLPDAIRVSLRVTQILEELGVPYLIVGSVANIIHGHLIEGDDSTVRLISNPETTALQKLWWFRRGNEVSDQQWRDVLGILKVKANRLDYDYLKHWAARLAVSDLLEKAFDDAGINLSLPEASDAESD
jgi:hypothetical protein